MIAVLSRTMGRMISVTIAKPLHYSQERSNNWTEDMSIHAGLTGNM